MADLRPNANTAFPEASHRTRIGIGEPHLPRLVGGAAWGGGLGKPRPYPAPDVDGLSALVPPGHRGRGGEPDRICRYPSRPRRGRTGYSSAGWDGGDAVCPPRGACHGSRGAGAGAGAAGADAVLGKPRAPFLRRHRLRGAQGAPRRGDRARRLSWATTTTWPSWPSARTQARRTTATLV